MILLRPHAQNDPNNLSQVMVDIKRDGEYLLANFQVKARDLYLSNDFSQTGWINNGLWNFDVVELFVQRENAKNHYLELEVSPKGQKVAILVKKPREDFLSVDPRGSDITAEITKKGFNAYFKILVSDIPGDGDLIIGNAHACLGRDQRSHYSLFEGVKAKPDFHRPDYFQDLVPI